MNRIDVINKSKDYIKNIPYPNPNIFTKYFFKDDLSHSWCGAFIYYIFKHDLNSNMLDSCTNFGYVPTIVKWAKKNNYWSNDYKKAKKGDLVIYNFTSNKNYYSHVGIINKVLDNSIESIEGNTNIGNYKNNCVARKTRNKKYISGVILLPYKEDTMDFKIGDYVIAKEDIKLYTTIEYKVSNYVLKKGDEAYIRYIKDNNIALAHPITHDYFKSAWTKELDKLEKKDIDYKTLYEQEKEENAKLINKINKAIEILNS